MMTAKNNDGKPDDTRSNSSSKPKGILVGEELAPGERAIGFSSPQASNQQARIIHAEPGEHGLVFAGTGAGKFTSFVAGNCLEHDGPLIVIDCKGEIDAVVSRARAERGPVCVVDPFGKSGRSDTYAFNPLDLAKIPGESVESVAEMLASILLSDYHSDRDPFWANTAQSWLAGLIADAGYSRSASKRHLGTVVDRVAAGCDELVAAYNLSLSKKQFVADRMQSLIDTPGRPTTHTRETVFTIMRQGLAVFDDPRVRRSLYGQRRLNFLQMFEGNSCNTWILVMPYNHVDSHLGLFSMWIEVTLSLLAARTVIPQARTRLIIDEASAWGRRRLPSMYSYLRATGTEMLTLWQSLGQLQDLYPHQWRAIVENSGVISAFGCHSTTSSATAELLGVSSAVAGELSQEEQLLLLRARKPRVARLIDYRTHPYLAGYHVDANPAYQHFDT